MGIRQPQPHRRQADETVDNHYRQLYQIRRAHGDVISRVGCCLLLLLTDRHCVHYKFMYCIIIVLYVLHNIDLSLIMVCMLVVCM